ncbi:MAG: hypothetical protein HQK85_10880, partial [Nitrospinae bacterium]|nr:hypothetical protein [Nitrospinota bacterium]
MDNLDRSVVAKMVKSFIEATEEVIGTTAQTKVEARTKAATIIEHSNIQ